MLVFVSKDNGMELPLPWELEVITGRRLRYRAVCSSWIFCWCRGCHGSIFLRQLEDVISQEITWH